MALGLNQPTRADEDADISGNWGYKLSYVFEGGGGGLDCLVTVSLADESITAFMNCPSLAPCLTVGELIGSIDNSAGTFELSGQVGEQRLTLQGSVSENTSASEEILGTWSAPDLRLFGETGVTGSFTGQSGPYGRARFGARPDSRDAFLILVHTTGLTPEFNCESGLDVNLDGQIASNDATLVLQYGARLIKDFPPP